ncbi:MAG: putative tellurium resistance membrane protein TerC [Alphaproteobacteria bacterium]|jgi:predicted tellurium resistance membrane protein TerC
MIEYLSDPAIWLSFATLSLLEIVLGIDNIIFISIIAERLPVARRQSARLTGLALALIMRIVLLFSLTWLIKLTTPLFTLFGHGFSWRDIILFAGGLFLLAKATIEIYETVEGEDKRVTATAAAAAGFGAIIVQIIVLDMVFSFDSILTAIGLTDQLPVMIAAVLVSIIIMMVAAEPVAHFVEQHLSVKILALSFLVLIGMVLVADGLGFHIPKAYVYASVGFSLAVQALVLLAHRRRRSGT